MLNSILADLSLQLSTPRPCFAQELQQKLLSELRLPQLFFFLLFLPLFLLFCFPLLILIPLVRLSQSAALFLLSLLFDVKLA